MPDRPHIHVRLRLSNFGFDMAYFLLYILGCTQATLLCSERISSLTELGTGLYLENCSVNVALPCVRDRRSVAYPNMLARGTSPAMTFVPFRYSTRVVLPLLLFKSLITCPMNSSER